MRRIATAALAVVAVLAAGLPGHAGTESARYVATPGGYEVNAPRSSTTGQKAGISGYAFPSRPGKKYTKVKIFDEITGRQGIPLLVCGDVCDPAEGGWQIGYCTNASGVASLSNTPIKKGERIVVFVLTVGQVEGVGAWANERECVNNGVTGTVTATFL
ncbi:MAG TPA: hypothetical protein VGB83_04740 [Actinomycetota bacterium]